jgi:hypothetical protein
LPAASNTACAPPAPSPEIAFKSFQPAEEDEELATDDCELDETDDERLDELVDETDELDELIDTLEELLLTTELDIADDTELVDDKLLDDCLLDELDGVESPPPPPPQAVK